MCGIAYLENKQSNNVFKSLKKRYYNQKSRGSEGFGFLSFDAQTRAIKSAYRSATEKEILDVLEKEAKSGVLFHHRFPTSTPNIPECNHPIIVNNDRLKHVYFVVHNGIITNEDELKIKHEKLGYKYTTELIERTSYEVAGVTYNDEPITKFNDSEALAIELVEVIEGLKDKCEAKGSIAFIVIQADKEAKDVINMYYGRNVSNPLKIQNHKGFFALTSEGGGDFVEDDTLFCRSYITGITSERDLEFPTTYSYDYKTTRRIGFNTDKEEDVDYHWGTMGFKNLQKQNTETMERLSRGKKSKKEKAEELDIIVIGEQDEYSSSKRMRNYYESMPITDYDIKELLGQGYSIDMVGNWVKKDKEMLGEILYNATVNKDSNEMMEATEILAHVEDAQEELDGIEKAIEKELDEMPGPSDDEDEKQVKVLF